MAMPDSFDGSTFFLFELFFKLQNPLVLQVSGIGQLLDPIGLFLVLNMKLAMKCLMLLQKIHKYKTLDQIPLILGG